VAAPGGGQQLKGPPEVAPGGSADLERARIERLPREVANAIAAGEVIERPASVVKELIENSLDAQATRITVEIEAGGTKLIRVVDNGQGLPAGDLALAFQRHATSKLREIDDLMRIATFGFRGEALASIAAVARVSVVSRQRASPAGAAIAVTGGEAGEVKAAAGAPGTTVELSELFHNVPARRAFLRSERTEASACLRVVAEAALGRPDVRFEARLGGRRALVSPGGGDLIEAARAVFGPGVAGQLLAVVWAGDGIEVTGVLGRPGTAHPNRNSLVVMVNGRRVHQRALVAAIEGAYRGMIEVGRHPLAVIDVRCAYGDVDVNVHPTKREVRFREEGRFFAAVQRACWGALQDMRPAGLTLAVDPAAPSVRTDSAQTLESRSGRWRESEPPDLLAEQAAPLDDGVRLAEAARWRYLGQAHNRYLVVETERGIALLDQHAAHEKVLYAKLFKDLTEGIGEEPAPSQGLLSPMLVDLGPLLVGGLADARHLLVRAGFDLEPFGESTIRCSAVPIGTRLSELPALLAEVLGDFSGDRGRPDDRIHRLAAAVACHSAVRFGDPVSREEVARLLSDLSVTPGGITCPHGRPAVLLLSDMQLLAAFRRRG
jgi:DNA mismatch repair protein MutL